LVVKAAASHVIRLILDGRPAAEYKTSEVAVELPPCEGRKYFRIELIDETGKRAWSAPFPVCRGTLP